MLQKSKQTLKVGAFPDINLKQRRLYAAAYKRYK